MSKFRELVEKILAENNRVIYTTYADEPYYTDITDSFLNKPRGGLWGCLDDSWREWCTREDFYCSDNRYDWTLKPGTKVFTINSEDDFIYLLKNYNKEENDYYMIDYLKLSNDYDAVELTSRGNNVLHYSLQNLDLETENPKYKKALSIALNLWDVPSICVFHPKETVEIIKPQN